MTEWKPIATIPTNGRFLVAKYAPTNWAYHIQSISLCEDLHPRQREMYLKYARAWMDAPPEPPQDVNDGI